MQNYHIYAHYVKEKGTSPTSVQHKGAVENRTQAVKSQVSEEKSQKMKAIPTPTKIAATGLMVAHKVNSYVGELTENRIAARRVQVGLTMAGIGLLSITNPVAGGIAFASYVGNAAVQYGIRNFKENLSAEYMRQLSGGTVKTGR
jgi:hypothetical protein